ncbi:MAG TPA: hypothetical protein VE570_11895 [Thermoleophilaceae bacterium]|nr:hypothetical protein [Thermoleophilaceae bacterium]
MAAVVAALAVAFPAASSADPLEPACEPPTPASAANCEIWHTTPVTIRWSFDGTVTGPVEGSDCGEHTITTDTTGTAFTCSVRTGGGSDVVTKTATVRIDQSAPAVTGAAPDRPPDHDGWYNHPVSFAFTATDFTSGVAGCDAIAYSGPDSGAAQVTGTCRDAAGNVGTGSAPLKYDATAPAISLEPQDSRAGEVSLKWTASPDAVGYTITREPGRDGAASSTVYAGTASSYTDGNVAPSQTYTYKISATDAAANSASIIVIAIPGGSQTVPATPPPTTPPGGAGTRKPAAKLPVLEWRRVRHADYYNIQVYRGRRKVLSAWPKGTRLHLRQSWRFRGKVYRLTPGRYDWYAWPGYGDRRAHRYGRMIVHKSFTIPKPAS